MILNRDQILTAVDQKVEPVEVPEWGGTVLVRGLTGAERDGYEAEMVSRRGKKVEFNLQNARAKLCARSIVDEHGVRLFNDDEDMLALGKKNAAALERVFEVARRLSGLTEDDVEELTKNSGSGQSADSGTRSP